MKTNSNLGMWSISVNDENVAVIDKSHLVDAVQETIASRQFGRLELWEDVGERSWFGRFIGLSARLKQMHLSLEWKDDAACLIFLDAADSEYRVIDRDVQVDFSEEIRKVISHGELTAAPANECMLLRRALSAIREFIQAGVRPDWLTYRYIK